jgi:hypothetical protein
VLGGGKCPKLMKNESPSSIMVNRNLN